MRITCVIGPFFPVPPVMGGAVERIFFALANEFARRGHAVTMISRRFKGLPDDELEGGIRHLRLPSRDAPANRLAYRLLDAIYALRVCRALPPSDITITHSVFLPLIIPRARAGQIYVSVARFPKGQMGLYRRVDRLQAVSSQVAAAICSQSPSVARLVKVIPNALGASFCEAIEVQRSPRQKEVLFVGRIAREKGIVTLIRGFSRLADRYPDWRLRIVGPHETRQGGDGQPFLELLKREAMRFIDRIEFVGPIFDEPTLIAQFKRAEIFVYPSMAVTGESFGMAPLEAFASGCSTLTSDLPCFTDFVRPGHNALTFDHRDTTGEDLARSLDALMSSQELRAALTSEAISTARMYTPSAVAEQFLEDFEELSSAQSPRIASRRGRIVPMKG